MTPGVLNTLKERLAREVGDASVSHGMLVLVLAPADLLGIVQGQTPRFEVVYHFYSTAHRVRVRLKTRVPEADPAVESLVPLYGSAHYMERECHDMYGIVFRGNPDLRPILLYEGFVGHPLRKDYPKRQEQPLVPYRS